MMRNTLHGLEPIVRVPKLRNYQCVMLVSCRIIELKPMLVSSEAVGYLDLVAKTLL